jgi:hypothetical protein
MAQEANTIRGAVIEPWQSEKMVMREHNSKFTSGFACANSDDGGKILLHLEEATNQFFRD